MCGEVLGWRTGEDQKFIDLESGNTQEAKTHRFYCSAIRLLDSEEIAASPLKITPYQSVWYHRRVQELHKG